MRACKFYKEQKLVSYDNGKTWIYTDVYRKGGFIEYNSADCGEI